MARRYKYKYLQKKRERQPVEECQSIKNHIEKRDKQLSINRRRRRRRRRSKKAKEMKVWMICALMILVSVSLFNTFVGQLVRVNGDSMLPTLHNGDILFVDKISMDVKELKRFEIVVFPHQEKRGYYIKRVIGLPGETLQIKDGTVYINGDKLEEPYIVPSIDEVFYGIAKEPVKLGENEYFVLGDNRNDSSDSRVSKIGILKKEDFRGRARVRLWASGSIGKL